MKKTIEIPEGYEAKIEGNKVILEPKESEDERIRKGLIDYFNDFTLPTFGGLEPKKILAWLEKQSEQRPVDKIEPKFKVGDWVIYKERDVDKIVKFDNEKARFESDDWLYIDELNKGCKLWTIQDAKDGDVLVASDDSIFLFKSVVDDGCKHYIALTTDNTVKFNEGLKHYWETSNAVYPATQEQRDILFQKMKEAGYEWDAEKKELKKIEQNPTWNKEDNPYYDDICEILINLLHSETADINKDAIQKDLDWLKSLKERYTWKPSDEQIKGIECVIKTLQHQLNVGDKRLNSLYNDLKKLKG